MTEKNIDVEALLRKKLGEDTESLERLSEIESKLLKVGRAAMEASLSQMMKTNTERLQGLVEQADQSKQIIDLLQEIKAGLVVQQSNIELERTVLERLREKLQ